MKKLLIAILVLLLLALAALPAAAVSDWPFPWPNDWQPNTWPDDIGGVYYSQETNRLTVLVVDPTEERLDELRKLLGEDTPFTPARYSFNELYRAREEIAAMAWEQCPVDSSLLWHNPESGINGLGVGLTQDETGEIIWPRESEGFRVTVTVSEDRYDHYVALFAERYGGMVVVEAGEFVVFDSPLALDEDTPSHSAEVHVTATWLWLIFPVIGLLGLAAIFLWRRKHIQSKIATSKGDTP